MAGPSTTRALHVRALETAHVLKFWREELLSEARGQNISEWRDDETIALKANFVALLIRAMHEQEDELRRYAKRPRNALRRAPPGFAP
jgi:hypothetical protein